MHRKDDRKCKKLQRETAGKKIGKRNWNGEKAQWGQGGAKMARCGGARVGLGWHGTMGPGWDWGGRNSREKENVLELLTLPRRRHY